LQKASSINNNVCAVIAVYWS